MDDHNNTKINIATRLLSALGGSSIAFITLNEALHVATVSLIGAVVGGVGGFYVNKLLHWLDDRKRRNHDNQK